MPIINITKKIGIKRDIELKEKLVSWFYYKNNLFYIFDDYKHNSLTIRPARSLSIHKEVFKNIKNEKDLHKEIIKIIKKNNYFRG